MESNQTNTIEILKAIVPNLRGDEAQVDENLAIPLYRGNVFWCWLNQDGTVFNKG